jgi:hypothetical protein
MREPVIGQEKLSKAESSSMTVGGVAGTCGTVRCISKYVGGLLRHSRAEAVDLFFLRGSHSKVLDAELSKSLCVCVCVCVCVYVCVRVLEEWERGNSRGGVKGIDKVHRRHFDMRRRQAVDRRRTRRDWVGMQRPQRDSCVRVTTWTPVWKTRGTKEVPSACERSKND